MRHRLTAIAAVIVLAMSVSGIASAAWITQGVGFGTAAAASVPGGSTPSVVVTGSNVAISWSVISFPDGAGVGGYRVARYDAGTGTPASVSAGCDGTVTALSCTEASVPPGAWRYGVTPVQGSWSGPESAWSASAVVGSPSFSLSSTAVITSLPSTRGGSLANFLTAETVEFHLDTQGGTLLAASTTPGTIPSDGAASASVTIPAGTSEGTHSVFAVGSGGSVATATVTVDTTAPAVSAGAIGKTAGGVTGHITQGGTYHVYAQVSDAVGTVSAVTADVSTVTTGSVAIVLTAGSYTAGGVSYNYRSVSLTANASLGAGVYPFAITAADANGTSGTTGGFSVTVDNTAPAGSDVQTANASGGIVGRAETGDTITFTYTETIDPNSIQASWSGAGTAVTVRLVNNGGNDQLQVWNSTDTTQLPLGAVSLGGNYTNSTRSFTGSTMTLSGATISIILGTPSGGIRRGANSTMSWTPSATATDPAGNACSTAPVTETGAVDREF